MGDRATHLRRRRLRSIQLQRVIELGCPNGDGVPQRADLNAPSKAAGGRPAMGNGSAAMSAPQHPRFKSVAEPERATADMVRSRPRLANPLDSARRVRDQLLHNGQAAAQTHGAVDRAHERIDVY